MSFTNSANRTITVSKEIAHKIIPWTITRGGIAVWSNKDLSSGSIGQQTFTPYMQANGTLTGPPHWSCGQIYDFVITNALDVQVQETAEYKRVKIRRGPPYNGGIHRADYGKVQTALVEAGEGSFYTFDYAHNGPWFTAVIHKVISTVNAE